MVPHDFENLYQTLLLDHARERHGYGSVENPSAQSRGVNRRCGDEVTLQILATDGVIGAIAWTGQGCAISQASASMLRDTVQGLTPQECTERIGALRTMLHSRGQDDGTIEHLGDAVALSGVARFPARISCAMLAWIALEDALGQVSEWSPPETTENTQ